MRVTGLKIGNYILHNGEVVNVTSLSESDDDWQRINNLRYLDTEDYFKPIPITEQWLIDFGFEYDFDEYTMQIDEENKIVIQNDMSYCIEDNQGNNIVLEDDFITTVHQLQNLFFSLTGGELKLKK